MYLELVAIYSSFILVTEGFYFHLKEGDEKCFVRELPDKTLFIAHYKCKPLDEKDPPVRHVNESAGMLVEIQDPHKHIVLSREYRAQGRFSFTSHVPGKHVICLHSKTAVFSGRTLRVDIGFEVGERAINYTAIAKKERLTELQTKYKQLIEKAAEVGKEMDYQRYREALFRESTETLCRRVLIWSVGQTIVLIVIAIWQMEQLRQFFESKKLV